MLFILLSSFPVHAFLGIPPKPPVSLPLAVHQAEQTASTDIRVVEDRTYLFLLEFKFNENDRADRARVDRLVGGYRKDKNGMLIDPPGIAIPLHLEIRASDAVGEEKVLFGQQVSVGLKYSWGAGSFNRLIGNIRLIPGHYRISVRNLSDHPELQGTPVFFVIGIRPKTGPLGEQHPSVEMASLLNQIREDDLLNHPTKLKRLPSESFFLGSDFPRMEPFSIPRPVATLDGCGHLVYLDPDSGSFWIVRTCGSDAPNVYRGTQRGREGSIREWRTR